MDNFDLKKYLAEDKLNEEELTTDAVVKALKGLDEDAASMLFKAYKAGHLSAESVINIAQSTGNVNEEKTDKYVEHVNVISLGLADHLSGDDKAQYVEFADEIRQWFMDNRNRFSNVGDVA
jgi:hypothetical protein